MQSWPHLVLGCMAAFMMAALLGGEGGKLADFIKYHLGLSYIYKSTQTGLSLLTLEQGKRNGSCEKGTERSREAGAGLLHMSRIALWVDSLSLTLSREYVSDRCRMCCFQAWSCLHLLQYPLLLYTPSHPCVACLLSGRP